VKGAIGFTIAGALLFYLLRPVVRAALASASMPSARDEFEKFETGCVRQAESASDQEGAKEMSSASTFSLQTMYRRNVSHFPTGKLVFTVLGAIAELEREPDR
jgi:hypothetical protein